MPNRLVFLSSLVSVVILLVMLNFTTPAGIGPLGVLLFFGLVYVVMFGAATLVVMMFKRVLTKRRGLAKKDYLYAAVIAFAPIMILLVLSLGSMSWLTLILVVMFVLLGCFLVNKRT